jgi:hypothetical protein
MFIPLVIKGGFRELAETEKNKLITFITQSGYVPVADTFKSHLKTVIDRWNHGELSRILMIEVISIKCLNLSAIYKSSRILQYIKMIGIIRRFLGMLIYKTSKGGNMTYGILP